MSKNRTTSKATPVPAPVVVQPWYVTEQLTSPDGNADVVQYEGGFDVRVLHLVEVLAIVQGVVSTTVAGPAREVRTYPLRVVADHGGMTVNIEVLRHFQHGMGDGKPFRIEAETGWSSHGAVDCANTFAFAGKLQDLALRVATQRQRLEESVGHLDRYFQQTTEMIVRAFFKRQEDTVRWTDMGDEHRHIAKRAVRRRAIGYCYELFEAAVERRLTIAENSLAKEG